MMCGCVFICLFGLFAPSVFYLFCFVCLSHPTFGRSTGTLEPATLDRTGRSELGPVEELWCAVEEIEEIQRPRFGPIEEMEIDSPV